MEPRCKSISSSFPVDLTSEILSRLPVKSVVRFRCVSKFWLSITTDPYFLETRNSKSRILLCFKEDDELVVSSIPQHTLSLNHTYSMKFPEISNNTFPPTASVHGLICFRTFTTVIVWNPSTRKFLTLPKPCKSWSNITVFLGYDPVEAKHKVIAMHSRSGGRVCRVITLGSDAQESWRIVKTNQKQRPYLYNGYGQCIKGVIYYLASTYETHALVIMRFDVRSEKFDAIKLPSDINVDRLVTYDGRIACVRKEDINNEKGITLWILEDAGEKKWFSKDFLAPFYYHDQSLQTRRPLIGFTHAGEFIYNPNLHHKSWYTLFFDLVRNNFRRFRFTGIADEEKRRYPIHIFPNHIKSLMSL